MEHTPRAAYRRLQAPALRRPTNRFAQGLGREPAPGPAGGIRTWSDDALYPGRLFEVDVVLGDRTLVTTVMEVAWCDEQPRGAPARFDVGLRFVVARRMDLERLEPVLDPP